MTFDYHLARTQMNASAMDALSGNSDRLDSALAEYMQRVDSGEQVDRKEFLAKHPEIADQLAAFLKDDSSLGKVIDSTQTVDFAHTPTPNRSRGLQIRCPHCCNHVELLVDTPYEEITCHSCGSTFSLVEREDPTRLAAPLKSIGRFDLIARLGIGGFGSVWKARDRELDRIVAVKIPRKGQLAASEIEQFFREARAAAQLRHPNIVPVHEVGREGETIFIVCDLIRGVELSDWLTAKPPSHRETVELCQKVARALHYAHQAGIIHRDLKPSNIMIDIEGEPHLMDFGLAKREVGEITMTVDGQILGTPAYMSPEQAAGRSHWTDRRTDVYSLGVVLYRMLSGELPFRGNAQMQVYQRLTDDPPSPRKLNRHIPRDLETICLKCLERDPNRRYASAQELANEFGRFLQGEPIQARPLSPPARLARWTKRKPWLAATAALLMFLAVAGPATAMRLSAQKTELEREAVKYTQLIARRNDDVRQLKDQNGDLRQELNHWEGKTNPWNFWPPRADQPLRRQLLHDLYQQRYQTVATQLDAGSSSEWESACGHMALARLAEMESDSTKADSHLHVAEKLLQKLSKEHPDVAAYSAALASCCVSLARQIAEDDPTESARYRKKASRLYERLSDGGGDDTPVYRINGIEAQWYGAVDAGFDSGGEFLEEVLQLKQRLAAEWPSDPVSLYEVVCFLAGDAPQSLPKAN